ncbi:Uncharacterized protein APZ42_016036 [Daphnia magna]|uniref:Uncharacterized protein n=1 Tax=Daphnia magna TaxID=35525 RepID=A0A162NIE7_9CRUS|nr:Uncharacterized protein APZ42_016036 [Daphnia magna]
MKKKKNKKKIDFCTSSQKSPKRIGIPFPVHFIYTYKQHLSPYLKANSSDFFFFFDFIFILFLFFSVFKT